MKFADVSFGDKVLVGLLDPARVVRITKTQFVAQLDRGGSRVRFLKIDGFEVGGRRVAEWWTPDLKRKSALLRTVYENLLIVYGRNSMARGIETTPGVDDLIHRSENDIQCLTDLVSALRDLRVYAAAPSSEDAATA